MNCQVHTAAMAAYLVLFQKEIEKSICELYNPDFTVLLPSEEGKELSFMFLDEFVIMLTVQKSEIRSIKALNYTEFIPDYFLKQFANLSNIPPRLARFIRLGTERLRKEIKECLQMERIICEQGRIATWEDYNLRFVVDGSGHLIQVLN